MRHRGYGYSLVMDDIDTIEYDWEGNAVAMIETKYGLVKDINLNSHQIRRQSKIADKLEIPFYVLVYYIWGKEKLIETDDPVSDITHVQYLLIAVNDLALDKSLPKEQLTEKQYIDFLYTIRQQDNPLIYDVKPYNEWKEIELPNITR